MKTNFTFKTANWLKSLMIVALLSFAFSGNIYAQHHHPPGPPHPSPKDSLEHWLDSLQHAWHDSLDVWEDSLHTIPSHTTRDSIDHWLDSLQRVVHDSLDFWEDSLHAHHPPRPLPPPPHGMRDSLDHMEDSLEAIYNKNIHHIEDSLRRIIHDSLDVWEDSLKSAHNPGLHHFVDSLRKVWHDSLEVWQDSLQNFPGDSNEHKHHRLADLNAPAASVTVSIYPNPVAESAVLHIENADGEMIFRMYDFAGRLAVIRTLTNGDFRLDRSGVPAGIYLYEVNDGNTSIAKGKLIFR